MARFLLLFVLAALCRAQNTAPLERILNFEADHNGTAPAGWGINNATVALDDEVVHGGKWAVRIERRAGASGPFGGISKMIPMDFAPGTIEMRGYLRSEDVTEHMGMWLRLDGEANAVLAFDSIQKLMVKGTNDWKQYSIKVPANKDGRQIYFGVFVSGTGKVWADDLELLVDGKPVWDSAQEGDRKDSHRYRYRVSRRFEDCAYFTDGGSGRKSRDARQGVGLSQISSSADHVGAAPLGLRALPHHARDTGGARPRGGECRARKMGCGSGRGRGLPAVRRAERG